MAVTRAEWDRMELIGRYLRTRGVDGELVMVEYRRCRHSGLELVGEVPVGSINTTTTVQQRDRHR